MIGYQVSEESGAALVHVLGQSVFESTEGSIWELVRELDLEFLKHRGSYTTADVVFVDVRVTSDLVARSQGRSKYTKSNASKQLQHVETPLLGVWRPPLDACGDGTGIVHAVPHPS